MQIINRPLPYENLLEDRQLKDIKLLVIHCTELPDLITARKFGEKVLYDSGTGNSGHYYIDRDGAVEQWVKPTKIAHHVRGHNPHSIGIELVNKGRYPDWLHSTKQTPTETYSKALITSLIRLIQQLQDEIPDLKHIAGHEDLDTELTPSSDKPETLVSRKIDPGPLFPWEQVMQKIRLINIGSNAKNYE